MVKKEEIERVRGYVEIGVEEGEKIVVDGRNLKMKGYEKGLYMGGWMLENVKKDMRI